MSEDTGTQNAQTSGEGQAPAPKAQPQSQSRAANGGDPDRTVPYHRFQEVNQSYKQLQTELDSIRQQQEQAEEERAQKQGEYQKIAEKYKSQAQQEKDKRQAIEQSWERERRLNVWVGAAAGVIKQEAVVDAFGMLDESEFANVDPKDESQVRRLAEMLVERKPYLADGPVGAGSGGSDRPILGAPQSPNGQVRQSNGSNIPMTSSGRMIFKKPNKRPSWK